MGPEGEVWGGEAVTLGPGHWAGAWSTLRPRHCADGDLAWPSRGPEMLVPEQCLSLPRLPVAG